ncbi:MAG TPA: TerC family protein [Methylomirabilota bacterium]|nr:TerC family protein [Methylomirabilota bacterium]
MNLDWQFIISWCKIVVLDLTLAGDNAVVIAMAVRRLPYRQQRIGICFGALGAVIVRVILTFAAAQLLRLPSLQLVGGFLLLWIAFRLLGPNGEQEPEIDHGATLIKAVRIIMIADLIMSTDNILAIAGASDGNSFLVLFGLALSIPIVVGGATFIAVLMSRYSWIVYVGAAILGEVAGKMILEDNFIGVMLGVASQQLEWSIRIGLAAAMVVTGLILARSSEVNRPSRPEQFGLDH